MPLGIDFANRAAPYLLTESCPFTFMATRYVTCPNCFSQNTGLNDRCTSCGSVMPPVHAPMQPVYSSGMTSSQSLPGKVQAIAIMQTVVGSFEILFSLFWFVYVLVLGIATFGIGLIMIPLPIILLAVGIISLVSGIKGLNKKISKKLSYTAAISEMIMILGCDVISFGIGLTGVILLGQEDTKAYFRQIGQ